MTHINILLLIASISLLLFGFKFNFEISKGTIEFKFEWGLIRCLKDKCSICEKKDKNWWKGKYAWDPDEPSQCRPCKVPPSQIYKEQKEGEKI